MTDAAGGLGAVQVRIAALQRRFAVAPTTSVPVDEPSARTAEIDFARLFAELQGSAPVTSAYEASATGDMRSDEARQRFATDLLRELGLPLTKENMRAMKAWQRAEGTSAAFNPLATTRHAPGATDMNEVGVKNFRSYEQGLRATIDTLRNGLYGNILAALRDGTSATRVAQAVADSPWGTGDGVSRVLASGLV
jgi:hypothetical protein